MRLGDEVVPTGSPPVFGNQLFIGLWGLSKQMELCQEMICYSVPGLGRWLVRFYKGIVV